MSFSPSGSYPTRKARPGGITLCGLLVLWCSLAAPCLVRGQPATTHVTQRLSQYLHTVWETEDGLPQNSVYAVERTRDGYLWLGTQDGLVRFDGVTFTRFNKFNVPALQSNEIRALLEDRHGGLWIGTNEGGVTRYFEGSFTTYTTDDGLSSNLIRSLYEDARGILWIGTIEGGLNRFDGTSFTSYSVEDGLAGHVVLALVEDAQGTLWIGTEAGLSRYRDGVLTTVPADLPGRVIFALDAALDGTLWIGMQDGGLAALRGDRVQSYSLKDGLCGQAVSTLARDPHGDLWIGTFDGGACRLRNATFDAFPSNVPLARQRIRAFHFDREASVWIGSEGGGLHQLRVGKFTPWTTAEGLSSPVVFPVLEDRQGVLWAGTEGGGLNRIGPDGITVLTKTQGLPSDDVYALHEDPDGSLWIGFYGGGLCNYADEHLRCYNRKDGLASENVYAILRDRAGTLWIGTDDGLHVLQEDRIVPVAQARAALHSVITTLVEDHEGALWIGTYDGLGVLKEGHLTVYTTEDGLGSNLILTLYEDDTGSLWVGTQEGGLCRFLRGTFTCLTVTDGLPNQGILQILEDDTGYLWLGSFQGVMRVAKQAIEEVFRGRSDHVPLDLFTSADGLPSSEVSGGVQPSAWRARDGRLWFATGKGLAVIDPSAIRVNMIPPPVHIESIQVDSTLMAPAEGLRIGPGARNLVFRYTGLSLARPDQVEFAYQLQGYEETWTAAGTRREAYFTNLPPGAYVFRVRARNGDGIWNETGAAIAFEIRPFFYQTRWFGGLCLLALVVLGFGAYHLRIARLKARERELKQLVARRTLDLQREKEQTERSKAVIEAQAQRLEELDRFKTRFFDNVSHEFRTPLTMIIGPLENALEGLYGALDAPLQRQLQIMLRNARRLLRLINQLLDLSKLEAGKSAVRARARDLRSFLEETVLAYTGFAEQKNIAFAFRSDAFALQIYFEPDKLEKVFHNLLSNAFKYTPEAGHITVTLDEHPATGDFPEGYAEVQVIDSGIGIAPQHLSYVFDRFRQVDESNARIVGSGIGLSLARELVLLHHGTITVESEEAVGTTFTVRLPKGHTHFKASDLVAEIENIEASDSGAAPASLLDVPVEDEADAAVLPDPPLETTPSDEDRPLVLAIDDNADIREYISTILKPHYRVRLACDGEEGLEKTRADQPHLVLCDVMMPGMDGTTYCHILKTDPTLNHIPVILLTARATQQNRLKGLEAGADDYLAKPFNARELLVRTKNLLQMRRQEKELKELNERLEQKVQEQLAVILEERVQYEASLIAAKEKAEESARLKTSILNNMSHELRTPITAIQGFGEILSMEVDEPLKEWTGYIESHVKRLLDTINSVLDLSRLESGDYEGHWSTFDLDVAVRDGVQPHQQAASMKQLVFNLHLPPSPHTIYFDRTAFLRILDILVGNAVKYTESGQIDVTVTRTQARLTLSVQDTGIGIGEAFLPHLFEAFQQESTGLDREHEGNGLGLSIAKHLVEGLGGTLSVTSQKGQGSAFLAQFKLTAPSDAATDRPSAFQLQNHIPFR